MKNTALLVLLSVTLLACSSMSGSSSSGDAKSSGASSSGASSASQVVDDATITAKVKSALLSDPDISSLKIGVDTQQGLVTLKGEIKTMALRKKVESIVQGVDGVKKIDNQLIITG